MIESRSLGIFATSLVGGVARVAAGVFWLLEGIFKYGAHFGSADIELVAQSASSNSRVPWYFQPIGAFMGSASGLFGVVIPALEVALGVLLILGIFSRLVAFAAIGTLGLYWTTDQLIAQYPVMLVLSALVLALPLAGRFGIDGWLQLRRGRKEGIRGEGSGCAAGGTRSRKPAVCVLGTHTRNPLESQ